MVHLQPRKPEGLKIKEEKVVDLKRNQRDFVDKIIVDEMRNLMDRLRSRQCKTKEKKDREHNNR